MNILQNYTSQYSLNSPRFSANRGHGCHSHQRSSWGGGRTQYISTFESRGQNFSSGFGVDLNGDGKMTRGRDGVLAFDLNQDGRISKSDIAESNRQLQLLNGTYPYLRSSRKGRRRRAAAERAALMKRFDLNKDGKVDNRELQLKGARVLVDSNQDGRFSSNEAQSLNRIRTMDGNFRLNSFSTSRNSTSVTNFGSRPSWGGFGLPGGFGSRGGFLSGLGLWGAMGSGRFGF